MNLNVIINLLIIVHIRNKKKMIQIKIGIGMFQDMNIVMKERYLILDILAHIQWTQWQWHFIF